jgi:hypothetical protein
MRVLFVALQIVLIATLALASLVATERSVGLAAVLFAAGGLRVFALRSLSLGQRFWPRMVYLADGLFAAPMVALLAWSLWDLAVSGVHSEGTGTGVVLLLLPAVSAGLCARLAPPRSDPSGQALRVDE